MKVLHEYARLMDFSGLPFDDGIPAPACGVRTCTSSTVTTSITKQKKNLQLLRQSLLISTIVRHDSRLPVHRTIDWRNGQFNLQITNPTTNILESKVLFLRNSYTKDCVKKIVSVREPSVGLC